MENAQQGNTNAGMSIKGVVLNILGCRAMFKVLMDPLKRKEFRMTTCNTGWLNTLIKAKEMAEKTDISLNPLLVRDFTEWSKRLDMCLKDINIQFFCPGRGPDRGPALQTQGDRGGAAHA